MLQAAVYASFKNFRNDRLRMLQGCQRLRMGYGSSSRSHVSCKSVSYVHGDKAARHCLITCE